jgi:intracellular sulfur oxidation DsrE/DsrF family protein
MPNPNPSEAPRRESRARRRADPPIETRKTMTNVLFIESRGADARDAFGGALAGALVRDGGRVAVLLVQNGALAARRGARAQQLDELAAAGVSVFADEFALRERGISRDRLRPGVEPALIDVVIDRLLDGWQVIWH